MKIFKSISDGELKLCRKGGQTKVITARISLGLWQRLMDHVKDKQDYDLIFSFNGKPFQRRRLYRIWQNACKAARVPYIPINQACRHSAASQLKEQCDIEAANKIKELLGHTNSRTSKDHYILTSDKKHSGTTQVQGLSTSPKGK